MRELAEVTPEVRDRLAVRFGDTVRAWCDALPELVDTLTARWRLELVEANGGGTSRVFRCLRRDTGTSAWLKLTPEPTLAREEAAALTAWAGSRRLVGSGNGGLLDPAALGRARGQLWNLPPTDPGRWCTAIFTAS
ncbi:hypothetical protein [Streptomyces chrestomyceticus]|uniref:hypothetical protein n=1 Tax=Streptomyces chrestomyceticus TaxID=68185 RepID=UPI0033FEDE32